MIRYFLLREVAFGQDGEVTYDALIDRVNADLADGLGNLASRTLTMIRNFCEGRPPRASGYAAEVRSGIEEAKAKFDQEFATLNFSRALEAAWSGLARVDKFITDNQPWKLAKDPSARPQLEGVLSVAYEGLRQLVLLVSPVLPESTRKIWEQMRLAGDPLLINPNEAKWDELIEVSQINNISPAFPKLDKERIMTEINNEALSSASSSSGEANAAQPEQPKKEDPASTSAAAARAESNVITIDDFVKVELRAATVLEAERIPKADKLLRLQVDLGEEKPRQILAGIAQHYEPENLVGRKIIVVSNLAPRKLRGLESNGMLLAASIGEEGRPVLATFIEDVPNGARLK